MIEAAIVVGIILIGLIYSYTYMSSNNRLGDMEKNNKIVYVELDTWNDMGEATDYLDNFKKKHHDKEVNYSAVFYDMAIIFCITTTEDYAKKYNLSEHIVEDLSSTMFGDYFPDYNPDKFGCDWEGEYEGWAPYKELNREIQKSLKKRNE